MLETRELLSINSENKKQTNCINSPERASDVELKKKRKKDPSSLCNQTTKQNWLSRPKSPNHARKSKEQKAKRKLTEAPSALTISSLILRIANNTN